MWARVDPWLDSLGFWGIYLVILLLSAIIYKTAFAIRLPVLKSAVVYLCLALGCVLLTVFHYMDLPIIEAMLVTVILIAVTRLRMRFVGKKSGNRKTE